MPSATVARATPDDVAEARPDDVSRLRLVQQWVDADDVLAALANEGDLRARGLGEPVQGRGAGQDG